MSAKAPFIVAKRALETKKAICVFRSLMMLLIRGSSRKPREKSFVSMVTSLKHTRKTCHFPETLRKHVPLFQLQAFKR